MARARANKISEGEDQSLSPKAQKLKANKPDKSGSGDARPSRKTDKSKAKSEQSKPAASMDTSAMLILATSFLVYFTATFCRRNLAAISPVLLQSSSLQTTDIGLLASFHAFSYSISKSLAWYLTDFVSLRPLLLGALVFNAVAMYLFTSCDALALFCAVQFFCGAFQGVTWPVCGKLVRTSVAPSVFGTWWGIVTASSNLAAFTCPLFAVAFCDPSTWQRSFYFGASASLFCAGFVILALPSRSSASSAKGAGPVKGSFWDLFKNRYVVGVALSYIALGCAKFALSQWLQVYLGEVGRSMNEAAALVSGGEMTGFFGALASGPLVDLVGRKVARPTLWTMTFSNTALAISLSVFILAAPTASLGILSLLSGTVGLFTNVSYAFYGMAAMQLVPAHMTGRSSALVDGSCSLGVIISGFPFSYLQQHLGWSAALWSLVAGLAITCVPLASLCVLSLSDKKKTE